MLRDEFTQNFTQGLQRLGTRVFGLIQHNIARLLLVVPEWVPKDSNLTVSLLISQLAASLGQGLPTVGKFQARFLRACAPVALRVAILSVPSASRAARLPMLVLSLSRAKPTAAGWRF